MNRTLILLSGLVMMMSSCLTLGEPYEKIPPGIWRGVLYLSDREDGFDERSGGELPFNFEVVYDTPDSFHLVIHNGKERIVVNDIRMGTDRRTARDTMWIDFPVYDTHIRAAYQEDAIEGFWVVRNRKDYQIQFKALHGQDYRFFQNPDPPAADLSGRWDCRFEIDTDDPSISIGVFEQNGNNITGTFVSKTGDDRFLEGVVSGDRLFLSVFDGTHAYLYEAKILSDSTISGIYRSGNHYKTYWEGKRNDTLSLLSLGDPYALTRTVDKSGFTIAFPDTAGKMVSSTDASFAGKPKIIQIMGTWCPNCRDETEFLLDYLSKNPEPGFEIIGISFERHTDRNKALNAIRTYQEKMKVPYPILYGGSNNKAEASKALPMLNEVVAFPTLIFLDKEDRVVAIHTGFNGPATPGYHEFVSQFNSLIDSIKMIKE